MRTDVFISHGYEDGVAHFIESLREVVAPLTIMGKEYVAIVKNDGAWIVRVDVGRKSCFENDTIFAAITNGAVIFIGHIPLGCNNTQDAVCQLIRDYWEKIRMSADKEATIMYRAPKEQREQIVM